MPHLLLTKLPIIVSKSESSLDKLASKTATIIKDWLGVWKMLEKAFRVKESEGLT